MSNVSSGFLDRWRAALVVALFERGVSVRSDKAAENQQDQRVGGKWCNEPIHVAVTQEDVFRSPRLPGPHRCCGRQDDPIDRMQPEDIEEFRAEHTPR